MLNDSFHCIPPLVDEYMHVAPKPNPASANCLGGICFWDRSTRFCKAPFCLSDNAPETQCISCSVSFKSKNTTDYLSKVCEDEVDTVAVKVIRFREISALKPFYSDDYDLNFRVIHLVRDPRSIMHSRKSVEKPNSYRFVETDGYIRTLKSECQALVKNYKLAQSDQNVKSKTLFIRYEDIALNVMKSISK